MLSQRRLGIVLGYTNIIVKNLVNLVYTPLLLHFVGKADYGVYQSSYSFVFSLTLLTFGFSEAYVRFYMEKRAQRDKNGIRQLNGMYLLLYSLISLATLVLGLLFAANVESVFARGFTLSQIALSRILIVLMSVNIACSLFSTVFDSYILAHERFTFQQSRQLLTTLAAPVLSYIFLELGMSVIGVAVAQLIMTIILLMLNLRYAVFSLGMHFKIKHLDFHMFKAVAVFSVWIFTNQICNLINENVPNVILGALSGATIAAVFAVSVQIRAVFTSLSTTMSSVFTPLINRIVAEDDDNSVLTKLMTRVGRYQAILYMWVWGGFILLGRFFITQWAGPGFDSVYWLLVVMVTPLFIPLVQNTGIEIQRAKNRHKARSIAYLCMAIVNVTITAGLSPYIGYWAPAIGYFAYVILGCGIFMNWYYHRHIGLDMVYFWKHVISVPCIAVVICGVCLFGTKILPVTNWGWFIVWGFVYTALYGGVAYRFALERGERRRLNSRIWHILHAKTKTVC